MFSCRNSIIELVNFDNPTIPDSLKNNSLWFSGFALISSASIENIKKDLQNLNLSVSDIIIQYVKNKEGDSIPISKILLVNNLIQNLQIFFIEYLNSFLLKKFEEVSKTSKWEIVNFKINEELKERIKNQLIQIGFTSSKDLIFSDMRKIQFSFEKSNSEIPRINSFNIKSEKEIINLVEFFEV
ncbi:hypothetical protein LPTSP2_04470 [Leptospira ellinghausenii]|uniref:Uncharacterized protein n=2 Tax=Leptospira ellinghausenii TaxID=1917822 RepID=A0A2P2D972_9LEPT|nr:hypothetical protein LPTSP2_04470 [Leptospira ellinghausenii]